MAGLGIGPQDFAVFEMDDPCERADALEEQVQPKLRALGGEIVGGLSRVAGKELHAHVSRVARRRGVAPGEVFVAFSDNAKGLRGVPYLALCVSRDQLHARVTVRGEGDRVAAMKRALEREAGNLARKGKPFRKLRHYRDWDCEQLPEIAPAHSSAFWRELAEGLEGSERGRTPLMDVGVAWPREEARSLAVGDVLGAFRDLAPLFKLLANAQ
jgi:uncharacterized protein YktB (UPF0637 family)